MFAGSSFGSTAFASGPVGASVSGFELFIGGLDLQATVLEGSIQIDGSINQRSIARFALVNPASAPSIGDIVQVRQDGVRLFGGTIDRIETRVDTARNKVLYQCECLDWQQFLDRRITTKTYTDQDASTIIRDILSTVIQDEGVGIHALDSGITFPLVKAEEVRVGDLIRDVAEGAGFTYWIDPDRQLHFVRTSPDTAPFTLGVGTVINPVLQTTREQYRNVQRVKVTGTVEGLTPNEVTIERVDTTGIAARQSNEGGSGQYMVFDSLTHPSSNDSIELERLARAYAKLRLTRSGAMRKVLRAGTYMRGLAPGQLGTVDLPDHGISGTWLITNLRTIREQVGRWRYDLEAVLTSPFELALDAYLRLVQAGRAIVQIPVALYTNLQTVTALGASSFTIPGSGDIDVEVTVYGGSGGGAPYSPIVNVNGGAGGPSGKAVTFLTVPAGTILDVTVGTKGTGGLGSSSPTNVSFTSPTTTTWTVPGSGMIEVEVTVNGAGGGASGGWSVGISPVPGFNGGAGGRGVSRILVAAGTVLDLTIGAGGSGGAFTSSEGASGAGSNGTLSKVMNGASTIAQGDGGGAGQPAPSGPTGTPGNGTGDTVTTGGGGSAGVGNTGPGPGGSGGNGSITIRYATANAATAGALSKVEVSGTVKAQGDGGGAGVSGAAGGSAGTPGVADGDQEFEGGAFTGGVGGVAGTPNGSDGQTGRVEIRY